MASSRRETSANEARAPCGVMPRSDGGITLAGSHAAIIRTIAVATPLGFRRASRLASAHDMRPQLGMRLAPVDLDAGRGAHALAGEVANEKRACFHPAGVGKLYSLDRRKYETGGTHAKISCTV